MNGPGGTRAVSGPPGAAGITLVELLVAVLLTAILLLGLVRFATAAGASQRLADNQARLQDQARTLQRMLGAAIGQAGFDPAPWASSPGLEDVLAGSADSVSPGGDRLVVRERSDRNCFGNLNPETDAGGRPAFFLRESGFDLNGGGYLTRSCRYGPTPDDLVTQVRRQGSVPGVERFRLRFAVDGDGDGNADRWVRAGQWHDARQVLGVRVGLLLRAEDPVAGAEGGEFTVLDETVTAPEDRRLRTALEFTVAMRGRSG